MCQDCFGLDLRIISCLIFMRRTWGAWFMKHPIAGMLALLAPVFSASAAAPSSTIEIAPTSDWTVNYANDSCRLSRTFGEGENAMSLSFDRFEPGDDFMLTVGGYRLAGHKGDRTSLRFGPGVHGEIDGLDEAYLSDLTPALYVTSARLHDMPAAKLGAQEAPSGLARETAARMTRTQHQIDPAVEDSIASLDVIAKGKPSLRLKLGSLGKPMAALRTCTDDLLANWGIDLAAHRGLTRPAIPVGSPGDWLTSSDYPDEPLMARQPGLVQVRLSVGVDGKPTDCFIQQSTRGAGFATTVCQALMRRGRFEPALGADGKPIASYWRTSVRFDIG